MAGTMGLGVGVGMVGLRPHLLALGYRLREQRQPAIIHENRKQRTQLHLAPLYCLHVPKSHSCGRVYRSSLQ